MGNELLHLANISKTFPGVKALDGIEFTLYSGEVHCICGENGAGKSTLIKIISGAYQPDDDGAIYFEGKKVRLDPLSAMNLGIQTIYQEGNVFETLSITENIFAGMEIVKNGIMQKQEMRRKTCDVLEYLHSDLNPDHLVMDLSPGEKKLVEIAKALVFERKVIILDEPTASFSVAEIEHLLGIIGKIRERGIGIIYISHHLDEVFRIADTITVLRDGRFVRSQPAEETDEPGLIRDMVGRDASAFYNRQFQPCQETILEVEHLSGNGVRDVTFDLHRGEILGFAGMVGSGRSELMTLLFGGAPRHGGTVRIHGSEVRFAAPADAIRHGMCFITEDRQRTGLFLEHTIARNTLIAGMVTMAGTCIHPREEMRIGNDFVHRLRTKAEDATVRTGNLSGGNQQKVVLAKWFNTDGEIFIFDEPTRGIDVGAKQEIYQIMMDLLADGKAIIMVSSDMPEVVSMSDRIMVMKDGRIVAELSRSEVSEENILKYSIGGTKI